MPAGSQTDRTEVVPDVPSPSRLAAAAGRSNAQLAESGATIDDIQDDTVTSSTPSEANMVMTAPLTTTGGSVTLRCQSFLGLPLVNDVKLTAIRTGALHVQ